MLEHEDHEQCWCLPEVVNICPDCKGWDEPNEQCWRCSGEGIVSLYDRSHPIIVIHQDEEVEE